MVTARATAQGQDSACGRACSPGEAAWWPSASYILGPGQGRACVSSSSSISSQDGILQDCHTELWVHQSPRQRRRWGGWGDGKSKIPLFSHLHGNLSKYLCHHSHLLKERTYNGAQFTLLIVHACEFGQIDKVM